MPLEDDIPELKQEHRDLLMLLRAAVARKELTTEYTKYTEQTELPIDWPAVLKIARFHQVDMFLYPAVASWPSEFQPSEDLMARWKSAFFGAVMKYERASAQLKELLKALHEADISVIPLKGAWLAENIYEHGAMRPMCDFDLLIPLEQFAQARTVFGKLGYTEGHYFRGLEYGKEIQYHHADQPMMIELHWRLWHERKAELFDPLNTNWIWSDLLNDQLHGSPVSAFSLERHLIYMAQHIQGHALTLPLRAYLDLALLTQRNSELLTDPALVAEAKNWPIPFAAKFILATALDLFQISPTKTFELFISSGREYGGEMQQAESAILQLNAENGKMMPLMEHYQKASALHLMKVGISKLLSTPEEIRQNYSNAVKKYGLVAGYFARWSFLFGRWLNVGRAKYSRDPETKSNLRNYKTRRDLSAWLYEKDQGKP